MGHANFHSRSNAAVATATDAARRAGELLLRYYERRGTLSIESKGLNDIVSNADREAEDVIAGVLKAAFPDDGFLGEETGHSGTSSAEYVWCVDPLDGTSNFLKGAHNWCVSIGLWSEGRPVLGVIYDPLRDELFAGGYGVAATCNATKITVSDVNDIDRTSFGMGHNHRVLPADFAADARRLFEQGGSFRQVGSGALMLAYAAAGRTDGYFERHMWPWDAVAGLAILEAAGGCSNRYIEPGIELARGDIVLVANPVLHSKMATMFGVG